MSRKKEQRKDEFESRSWTKQMHTPKNVENDRELFSWDYAGNIYMPSPTEHIKFTALPNAITDAAFDRILRSCEPGFFDSEPDLSVVRFAEENDPEENAFKEPFITEMENVRSKLNTENIADESSDEELEIINRFLLSKQEKKSEAKWDTEKDCNIEQIKAFKSEDTSTSKGAYPSTSNGILTCASEIEDPTTISKASWPSTSNESLHLMFPTINSKTCSTTTLGGPSTSAPATDIKVCFAEIEQLLSEDNERNRLMFSAPTPPPYNRGMFKSSEVRKRTLIQNDPLNIQVKYKKRFTGKIIGIENSSDIEIEQKRLATNLIFNSSKIPRNQAVPVDLEQYKLLLKNIYFKEELRHQKELEEQLQQLLQKLQHPRRDAILPVDFELYKLMLQKLQRDEELQLQQKHDQKLKQTLQKQQHKDN